MPNYIKTLTIAGTRFQVHFSSPSPVIQMDPVYADFIDCDKSDLDQAYHQVNVKIREGSLDQKIERSPIFHTDDAWSLAQIENGYLFSSNNPDVRNQYGWDVLCDKSFDNLEIILPPGSLKNWLRGGSGIPALQYPLDQILFFHTLSKRAGLLIHTAGIQINNKGWLFSGPSGAGKSTISSMLLNNDGVRVINDDRMVIRQNNNNWYAHGTPWPGDLKIADNAKMPLSALCFLSRGSEMQIKELDPTAALRRLFPVISIPWYLEELLAPSLETCEKLITSIPVYELSFKPGDPVLDILEYDKAA